MQPPPPEDAAALDPNDPLAVLDRAFHDAYAARREAVLAGLGPVLAQIGDRLILRVGGRRLEGPARTRRYHELKAISHVPITVHLVLSRGVVDLDRDRIVALRATLAAARAGLDRCCLDDAQLGRQQAILTAADEILARALAGEVDEAALRAYVRAQTPEIVRNIEDAARDQVTTMHATLSAWRPQLTPDERARLRAVVAVSHMSRPGNVGVQYLSVALGERWGGRFDQEDPGVDKRVLASEATTDEPTALALLATHALDEQLARTFFREEGKMERDLLADTAERLLADMFDKDPEPGV